jgi:hypothetical protein
VLGFSQRRSGTVAKEKSKVVRNLKSYLAAAVGGCIATTSFAGFTQIKAPPGTEAGQLQIFQHTYGGTWHKVGDDFYSGSISAKRLDDWLGSGMGVSSLSDGECGNACDGMFSGGQFEARAVAKFSLNSQSFGCVDSGGSTHTLFDVGGYGFDTTGGGTVSHDMYGESFKWIRTGDSGTQTSVDTDNADGRDHLATYVISGLEGQTDPIFMLFWEDLDKTLGMSKNRSFADFNDLAVEIRAGGGNVNPVPLPPAAWAGLITMGGAALAKKRLRKVTA